MNDEKIGIVGHGYVGEAITQNIIPPFRVVIIDPAKGYKATYCEIKKDCSSVFICVPSPQKSDGNCDTSIFESVLNNLEGYTGTIISKVTAPPEFYEEQSKRFPNLVYVPEFLRADTAITDFNKTDWIIVGGSVIAYQREAARILKEIQPSIKHVEYCGIGEAAFVKYSVNTFLATKVVFMNELNQLAEIHNYDWKYLAYLIKMDRRIGDSHTQVPGPDGFYGFGGACFPKDTEAFIKYAEDRGVNLNILGAAVKKNTLLRLTKPK
jgi:nucleotide sugar dehydrogenase